ncbi:MAG: GTP cyclohydrolase-4 [Chloroflexi bacterium]|jgi:2-amino-4-hydroxy-6-hydroxymethyldihydropteridine diphosphokinase|nr:MAG: GTP cyclohydrolase-4 [Chloroflexota bacterium]
MTDAPAETVFLGLGSNLGDREANLTNAVELLAKRALLDLVLSPIYETEPVDFEDQPQFLNAVVQGRTTLSPQALLRVTKEIEREVGRTATFRYGPRVIDIDFLFYGGAVLEQELLTVPHPRIAERAFVLIPLTDLSPEWVHPVLGLALKELVERVEGREGVRLWRRVWGNANWSSGGE